MSDNNNNEEQELTEEEQRKQYAEQLKKQYQQVNYLNNEQEEEIKETEYHIIKKDQIDKEITIALIAETSLDQNVIKSLGEDEKLDLLHNLKSIQLGWLQIKKIDRLDIFDKLEILYLQHNKIEKIENLDFLVNLEYLGLNNNLIKKVENINHLKKLCYVSFQNNQIQDLDTKELPENLQMISFKGNPVIQQKNYKYDIIDRCPSLDQLDGQDLTCEQKFKILGIFPEHLEIYSEGVKNFYLQNQEKQEKMDELMLKITSFDKIKDKMAKDTTIEDQLDQYDKEKLNEGDQNEKLQTIKEEKKEDDEQDKIQNEQKENQDEKNSQQQNIKENVYDELTKSMVLKAIYQSNNNSQLRQSMSKSKIIQKQQEKEKENEQQKLLTNSQEQFRILQEKTLRILEKQKDKAFQMKKKYLIEARDQAELHQNIITSVKAQQQQNKINKQLGANEDGSNKTDQALDDIKDYFQQQLNKFEEENLRKALKQNRDIPKIDTYNEY